METYLSIYLISLFLLVSITAAISIHAFTHWQTPGARTLGLLMSSMTVWAGFYMLEILHPALGVKIAARKILYIGMALSPAFWLGFALRYTGWNTWWSQRGHVFLLAIPGGVACLLGLANEFHHLIWSSWALAPGGPAPLILEYGAGFWFFTALSYTYILFGFLIYLISFIQSDPILRVKTGIILAGALITASANLAFLVIPNDLQLDPTPLSFAFATPLIAFGYFRFGAVRLFPLAAPLVVESLKDAILVVNMRNEITDLNQAAKKLFDIQEGRENISVFDILPRLTSLQQVWDDADARQRMEIVSGAQSQMFDVRIIPIRPSGANQIGRALVFHDFTNEHLLLKGERRRAQQLRLLEETGRRIADSFDENEILQRAIDAIVKQFGYPMSAISKLTEDNMLEVVAIAATDDFGYQLGYKQPFGLGIIGYTARLQKTYVTQNVSKDPHYFSTSTKSGSALCAPILMRDKLFGVLYVESFELNAFDELDVITLETLASQLSESLQRASLYAQTRDHLRTLETIQNISRLVASSLDLETISQTVVNSLKDAFGYTHVSIYFLREDYLHLAAQVGYPAEMIIQKIHISQGVSGKTIRTKSVQFIEDTAKEDIFLEADERVVSEICVPLLKDDIVLGTLNVESTLQKQLKPSDVELLTAIAGPIAVAVDNARLHTKLKKMATTDAVTGLSNRHVFEQALSAEIERAARNNTPLSLLIFDIDNFKEYNDQYGHPAGDARLRAIANIINFNLRKYDIAAHYGGDEFAIILSNCTQENAVAFAERLQQGTQAGSPEAYTGSSPNAPGHSLSIGIATYPKDSINPTELLIAADHAAMRAKQQGRNRITLANIYDTT
ncbi:MAG: diguanylate cyclase [Chloroflexi bacterium]|nr:diguanylate cyclase [Chloroflexota bacterium]